MPRTAVQAACYGDFIMLVYLFFLKSSKCLEIPPSWCWVGKEKTRIFISYTKLPIALHSHTWVWELAPGAICAYASPTFGRPEGEGRETGGLSSQTACSRCMNSPQLRSGRQPPESPWPGLNTADHSEPKPCLTVAFTGSTRGVTCKSGGICRNQTVTVQ